MKKLSIIILSFVFIFAAQSVSAQKQSKAQLKPAPKSLIILITQHMKDLENQDRVALQKTMYGTPPTKGFNIGMPPMIVDSIFVMKAYDLNPNDLSVVVKSHKRSPRMATSIPIKPGSKTYKALKMAGKDPSYYTMFYVKNKGGYKVALP